MIRRFAVAGLLLVLAGCGEGGLSQLKAGEEGRVAQVRSGDTLVMEDGLVVRLAGIDAPNDDQPYAGAARSALESLTLGEPVQLLYGGARRDDNGRALAHVRLVKGQVWVQQRLLREGAARVRTYDNNRALAEPLLDDEARARQQGKGLWGLPYYRVRLPVEAEAVRGYSLIEGWVTDVRTDAYGQALIMDGVLRVEVEGYNARKLALSGLEPASLKGKLVRLRASIRRDGGIKLTHREQVEILRNVRPRGPA